MTYYKKIKDENKHVTEKKAVSWNELSKISSENPVKKQKYTISNFEDTDETDREDYEMDHYIALKPSTLKDNNGNQIDILKWWHANKANFP